MKKIISLLFIFCICFCSAQQPVITKLDKKTVIGKLIGKKSQSGFTNIRIRKNKHYYRREFEYNGTLELSKGKWKIKNDTLILTEKFYKHKLYENNRSYFFTFRKREKRTVMSKLILYNGQWMEIEDNKYIAKQVFSHYVHKGIAWVHKNVK